MRDAGLRGCHERTHDPLVATTKDRVGLGKVGTGKALGHPGHHPVSGLGEGDAQGLGAHGGGLVIHDSALARRAVGADR